MRDCWHDRRVHAFGWDECAMSEKTVTREDYNLILSKYKRATRVLEDIRRNAPDGVWEIAEKYFNERDLENRIKNRGEKAPSAKLKESEVKDIFLSDMTDRDLAKKYRVHACTINSIRRGGTWRNLTRSLRGVE